MKRATSHDVARKAGVSRTTVSLVLNGSDLLNVTDETRKRVHEAARALNYRPNRAALGLVKGRSETFGIVVTHPTLLAVDGFVTALIQALVIRSREQGYRVILDYVSGQGERTYTNLVSEGSVDGLMVINPLSGDSELCNIIETGFPVVLIGQMGSPNEHSVRTDIESGVGAVIKHLSDLGHQRIAHVAFAPPQFIAGKARLSAYTRAIAELNLQQEHELVVHAAFSAASAREATHRLLDGMSKPPTAIFAGNDTIAVGVLRALTERGLRVPQDIALAGFDDLPIASMLSPSLTTVRHDPSQHAALAADMLVRQIHRKAVTERQVEIAPELVVRESCGRLSD